MQNKLLTGFGLILLAGCATQPPAPIEQGASGLPVATENTIVYRAGETETAVPRSAVRVDQFSTDAAQTYLVQPGDTLSQIARHFNVSTRDLAARNNLSADAVLALGQVLIIPAEGEAVVVSSAPVTSSRFTDRVSADRAPVAEPVAREVVAAPSAPSQPPAPVNEKQLQENVGYTYHRVEAGQNLFRIGLKYDVSVFDLMNLNNIEKPEALQAGDMLKIPLARSHSAEQKALNLRAAQSEGMIWPVQGQLAQRFGEQSRGVTFTGITIMADAGTAIAAAAEGNVIYAAGGLRAYGNLILIRHGDGLITAYGHVDEIMVKKGDFIRKGQIIARVGQSGNVDRPQLHFEVRRNTQAIDPLKILPRQ